MTLEKGMVKVICKINEKVLKYDFIFSTIKTIERR